MTAIILIFLLHLHGISYYSFIIKLLKLNLFLTCAVHENTSQSRKKNIVKMQTRLLVGIFPAIIFVLVIDFSLGSGLDYVVSKNKKCIFNVSEHLSASSVIKCATECGKRSGCKRANFKKPDCEILISDSAPNLEEEMVDAHGWKCIRKYYA